MAELFGTAAGVLQVAEVGFNLATTLYKYASTVKGAERDIKRIARDVKLTSKVLERTHEQLKADKQAQLCTDDALVDLEDVLEGCREAFQEVDDALNKSMKPSSGKTVISLAEKLKWPLKQDKLEVLRANLEKLKTTLLLMLSVFAYGSKVQHIHAAKTDIKVELSLEKLQIQNLIQAKDEATSRYEQLSAAFTKLETRINESANNVPHLAMPSIQPNTISMMAIPNQTPQSQNTESVIGSQRATGCSSAVSERLKLCAASVSNLTSSIDAVTKRWENHQILEHSSISEALVKTTTVVEALRAHDAGFAMHAQATPGPLGFTYPKDLARHQRETHDKKHGRPKAGLICPHVDCKRHTGKGFTREENLNEHLHRIHGSTLFPMDHSDTEGHETHEPGEHYAIGLLGGKDEVDDWPDPDLPSRQDRTMVEIHHDEWLKIKEREAEEYEDRMIRMRESIHDIPVIDEDESKSLFASLKKPAPKLRVLHPDDMAPSPATRPKPTALKLDTAKAVEAEPSPTAAGPQLAYWGHWEATTSTAPTVARARQAGPDGLVSDHGNSTQDTLADSGIVGGGERDEPLLPALVNYDELVALRYAREMKCAQNLAALRESNRKRRPKRVHDFDDGDIIDQPSETTNSETVIPPRFGPPKSRAVVPGAAQASPDSLALDFGSIEYDGDVMYERLETGRDGLTFDDFDAGEACDLDLGLDLDLEVDKENDEDEDDMEGNDAVDDLLRRWTKVPLNA
ncbi:hypothetical protein PRZ48_008538 [Zasmidium cellare]|uniref:C2H2-domain containing protein second zinc finger domain-containing protein n=1 Tax=Zasmidium cellare TaxID=395010 RepID=A0ABR0EFS6_ZASCE|nr:hypothetical protein PRZ48_008538 [Zasmidium cellare]